MVGSQQSNARSHTHPAQKWCEICEVSVWRGLRDLGEVDREDGARRGKLCEVCAGEGERSVAQSGDVEWSCPSRQCRECLSFNVTSRTE